MSSSLFESLEQRLQFSTSEVVDQDTLNVFGTGGKDNISVDMMDFVQDGTGRVFHATVNGDRESYETEFITHINIFGVNGNDHIDLNDLPIGVKTIIYCGQGNDTLTAGDIRGEVKFLAGGGTNRVDAVGSTFDEAGIFYPIKDYLFDGKGIKDGANGITWTPGTVQKVSFEADAGDDTLDVTAVPAGQTLSLTGNGGDDLFKVGNGDIAAHIRGSLNINGSVFTPPNASEKNMIVFDDSKSDGGVDQFAIGSFKTLAMSNPIKLKNIDHLTLNASNDNDIINVTSSSASEKAIQINARGGNDFVSVGSASIGLGSVKSTAIGVDGGSGNDVVSADDRSASGFNSYVVTASGFTRGGTTPWSTSHIERFDLFASAGGSTINAIGSSVPVDLFGGNGNDIMYGSIFNDVLMGGAGNDQLSGLQGNDSLAGGTGNDTLDGGAGNDSLAGGADQDQLFSNDGEKDSLDGGAGNDAFHKDSKDIFTTIA